MRPRERVLLTGNHAVAWGARLARPKVIPVYPITPQTPVLELLTEFHAAGDIPANFNRFTNFLRFFLLLFFANL